MELRIPPELIERLDRERAKRDELAKTVFATFDLTALTLLRPGMLVTALAEILGPSWTPLPPASKGYFFDFSAAGLTARIDLEDTIGALGFSAFPIPYEIEGLAIGMTEEQVLAAQPDLKFCPGNEKYGYKEFKGKTSSGFLLRVAVFAEKGLMQIDLSLPDRRYFKGNERIKALPGRYPKPSGKAGAPFKDPNLKLVVLSELLRTKQIDLGKPEDLIDHVMRRHVDVEEEGYELLRPAYKYLTRYPLTETMLDSVTTLEFDGGLDIYPYIWPFWDGESDEFDIRSLIGIEHCRNLKSIKVISMVADEAKADDFISALSQKPGNENKTTTDAKKDE